MKVDNLKLLRRLKELERKAAAQMPASVVVGYTRIGALRLHEMTPKHLGEPRPSGKGVKWGPSLYGNKFLEGPAREFAPQIAALVRGTYKRTGDLIQALEVGGLKLQAESQRRVPTEHGDLRRSAFTERE